jgi:hypothetical protein
LDVDHSPRADLPDDRRSLGLEEIRGQDFVVVVVKRVESHRGQFLKHTKRSENLGVGGTNTKWVAACGEDG